MNNLFFFNVYYMRKLMCCLFTAFILKCMCILNQHITLNIYKFCQLYLNSARSREKELKNEGKFICQICSLIQVQNPKQILIN